MNSYRIAILHSIIFAIIGGLILFFKKKEKIINNLRLVFIKVITEI